KARYRTEKPPNRSAEYPESFPTAPSCRRSRLPSRERVRLASLHVRVAPKVRNSFACTDSSPRKAVPLRRATEQRSAGVAECQTKRGNAEKAARVTVTRRMLLFAQRPAPKSAQRPAASVRCIADLCFETASSRSSRQ